MSTTRLPSWPGRRTLSPRPSIASCSLSVQDELGGARRVGRRTGARDRRGARHERQCRPVALARCLARWPDTRDATRKRATEKHPAISTDEADRRTAADRSYRRDDAWHSQGCSSTIPSSPEGAADEPLSARRTTISSWTRSSRATTTRTSSPESSLSVARSRIRTKCGTADTDPTAAMTRQRTPRPVATSHPDGHDGLRTIATARIVLVCHVVCGNRNRCHALERNRAGDQAQCSESCAERAAPCPAGSWCGLVDVVELAIAGDREHFEPTIGVRRCRDATVAARGRGWI